jgi:hypothetical protein
MRIARHPPRWLVLTLLLMGIEVSYVFIISSGRFTTWSTWNNNYDLLAEGFRSGHLHMSVEPSPELLAQPNPFDYANLPLWFWDASLHGGHYYFYWGPLPAVLLAAVKTVFRIKVPVGDQFPVFAFYSLYLIAGALLIDRLARKLFDGLPLWLEMLGIVVFAYAIPTPFLIGTPGIYEAPIAGGQAFLLLGLLLAFDAIAVGGARPHPRRALLGTGICWGLAMACRVSVAPAAGLILLASVFLSRRPSSSPALGAWRERFPTLAVALAPLAAVTIALLSYNKARFGEWLNFGLRCQVNNMPLRQSFWYVGPNLFAYWLRPLSGSCRFPFLSPLSYDRGFPSWLKFPEGYTPPEPLAGLLVAVPWVWLTPVTVFFAGRTAIRSWRARGGALDGDPRLRLNLWCVLAFVVLGTVTGLPALLVCSATMRYLADVITGILLFNIWGAWSLYREVSARPWPRRLVVTALVGLAGTTVIIGLLLGIQGYDNGFERNNPELFARWVRWLSRC